MSAVSLVEMSGVTSEEARWLRTLNDGSRGTAVITVRAGMRDRVMWLANDLLAAIGVRRDVTGIFKSMYDDWSLVPVWFQANDVADLIVLDTQLLPLDVLRELLELACLIDVHLWLVVSPPLSDELVALLEAWPTRVSSKAAFWTHWSDRRRVDDDEDPRPARGERFPSVPATDFPTFRSDCRNVLDPDEFEIVDALYRTSLHEMVRRFARRAPTEQTIAKQLRDMIDGCAVVDEMMTVVRATQAALLPLGWFVQVNIDGFLAAADSVPTAAARSEQVVARLSAYRQPWRSSACALAAAGLGASDMAELTVGDVPEDGSAVELHGEVRTVEPAFRRYLKALILERRFDGARDDDPLMCDTGGQQLRPRALATAVTIARTETGVLVAAKPVERRRVDDPRWAQRLGVSIQEVTP